MTKMKKNYLYHREKLIIYLERIRNRLSNEIKVAILAPDDAFWTGIRLLMPVIEDICSVYRINKYKFMRERLGIPYPLLMWNMFRNTLLHRDEMSVVKYGSTTISWAISTGAYRHSFRGKHVRIDIVNLYNDLMDFVDEEISKNPQRNVWIQSGVQFIKPRAELKKEIKDIS